MTNHSMEGFDVTSSSLQEFPRVRAVKATDPHRFQHYWIEVPKVYSVARSRLGLQWLPVRDASACRAADRSECLISLNVSDGVLRVAGHLDGSEFVVGPKTAEAPAERTIAARGLLGG